MHTSGVVVNKELIFSLIFFQLLFFLFNVVQVQVHVEGK